MSIVITGVRTIGVPVADQDRAVEFYVGLLGLEKRVDVPLGRLGGRWIEVAPPGSATTIALVPAGERTNTGVETGIRLTTADAASLHEELAAHGIAVGELLRWEGVPPMFAFRDADGNGLEIVQ
ncbi:VOC family protein [Nonomuraea sp. 3-1Str]|uniref:VOC family protein n=1 Tax=unclassified Nonomuraea TaxID=2593643 RepID=UPI0028607A20|nr:VOC family protein [Nonomuraea sp. 3-1Str]MDR8411355.1 VOC family protein [Nonomuraea sp. 3-1Str]